MKTKPKYPPKSVQPNFSEKLPELKKRPSRMIALEKLPETIRARIVLEKLLSVHHKGNEQEDIKQLGEAGRKVLHKILHEPNSFDYIIRRDAISALTNYNDANSILLLASLVNDPKEDEVNIGRALDAIAVIGGHGANRILTQAYRYGHRKYVKNRALKAILRCNDTCFIPILMEVVKRHKSPQLRLKAFEKLTTFGVSMPRSNIPELKGDITSRVTKDK
jgi:hypothetical protein